MSAISEGTGGTEFTVDLDKRVGVGTLSSTIAS
jgi:hypothetical protein